MITLARALDEATRRLAAAGVATPRLDARVLLCHALGCGPETLVGHGDRALNPAAAGRFAAGVTRRAGREPVAAITGRRGFWTLDLIVTGATLDPRPDSETVIEAVLARLGDRARPLRLLDLGTGSGCLLLALLAELPAATGVGIDRDPEAVRVARANAGRNGLASRAAFAVGDWASAIAGRFDVVVANPPYIPTADIAGLAPEVAHHEPRAALDGGADGLDAYRAIVPALPGVLLGAGGLAAFEVGQGQADVVAGLLAGRGFVAVEHARDLAGIARVVVAMAPWAPKICLGKTPDVR